MIACSCPVAARISLKPLILCGLIAKPKTLSPLQSALAKNAPVTPLQSALPKSLDLKPFRIRTYGKRQGEGYELLTNRSTGTPACAQTTAERSNVTGAQDRVGHPHGRLVCSGTASTTRYSLFFPHNRQRIHPRPIHSQSPMQVGASDPPRRSNFAQHHAGLHHIAGLHGNLRKMAVQRVHAKPMIDQHRIPAF